MELEDCAFPQLAGVVVTDDPVTIDAAMLVGSCPRSKGMERRDLLATNAEIFKTQSRALDAAAKREAGVVVVGNPANTNAAILASNAPDFPKENITSMIRLDCNRAVSQIAAKAGACRTGRRAHGRGNHSPTMFADRRFATADGNSLSILRGDDGWYRETLIPTIAQRGTAVLNARGASSAGISC